MAGAALRLDPPRLDRAFALAARHVEDGITGYAGLAVGSDPVVSFFRYMNTTIRM